MSKYLLFFIAGNVALIALTWFTRKTRRLNNVVLSCTTIFLFLSIVETVYRNWVKPAPVHLANASWLVSFRPDSLLGHQIGKTGAAYTLVADSIGNYLYYHRVGYSSPRSTDSQPNVPAISREVVFLGCSFTFGQGVRDSETVAYKVGMLRNIPTVNLGNPGYGIHQVYKIFLDKYAAVSNTHRLFVYTLLADHVLRAAGLYDFSAGPGFRLIGDSLQYAGPLQVVRHRAAYYASLFGCYSCVKDGIIAIQDEYWAKRVPAEEFQKAYVMIRNMDRYAKKTGGRFLLVFWDTPSFGNDPNRYYRGLLESKLERLKAGGVDMIRVSDFMNTQDKGYYIPMDNHPNAKAYDTVARWIAGHL